MRGRSGDAPGSERQAARHRRIIENAQVLTALVRVMGADRVVFGTDYASANRDKRPVEFIESLTDLTQRERDLILAGNAARLFRL